MEPCVVRLHHPHRSTQLHGGEGPHPRQHRDLRLHGERRATVAGGDGRAAVSNVSLFQKQQLSAQSLAFNLKDKVFCELFPDVVDVS